jgi:hypothetical protein
MFRVIVVAALALAGCTSAITGVGLSPGHETAGQVSPLGDRVNALPSTPAGGGPAVLAERTKMDEYSGIAVTRAYTALSRLGAALVRAGIVDREAFKRADQAGYDAVTAISVMYLAGNARGYGEAVDRANEAVEAFGRLIPGGQAAAK